MLDRSMLDRSMLDRSMLDRFMLDRSMLVRSMSGGSAFKPNIEGPLMGGTCRRMGLGEFSATSCTTFSTMAGRCGSCAFTILDAATGELGAAVAFADRRASSKVPHIPQKRKVFELFSPHFGQITMVLPIFLSISLSFTLSFTLSLTLSFILTLAGSVIRCIHPY